MKLKQWLLEYHQMAYADYKALPDEDKWSLEGEFQRYNRLMQIHEKQNWRPATEEETKHYNAIYDKEKQRYKTSLKIGGIDERGNYTALHYRWN